MRAQLHRPSHKTPMPHSRRRILANACYELCFRARATLPFVAYEVINLIIASSLARTQRDQKVTLCHDIWEGSHCHQLIVTKDSKQCVKYYGEIQKRITDALKRLLGLDFLQIWEGQPTVAHVADIDKAKDRIAYFYANPAQDNLVESIEKFPGYSSWNSFNRTLSSMSAVHHQTVPWIRLPTIPKLESPTLTSHDDSRVVRLLTKLNKAKHTLTREPNAWMRVFGVETDTDAREHNQEILGLIREREKTARELRAQTGKPILGSAKLRSQPILKSHQPKKKDRKIFVLTSIKALRLELIEEFKAFCIKCRLCYLRWLSGDINVKWPPEAFKPPLPPSANILAQAA